MPPDSVAGETMPSMRRIPGVGRLYISGHTDKKVEYRLRRVGWITKLLKAGDLETLGSSNAAC